MVILPAVLALLLAQETPPVLTPDQWVRQPPLEYPERAQARDVRRGFVVLDCHFDQAVVTDCTVVEETPAGFGFGASALRAVRRGVAVEGVEGRRTIRLDFVLG
ncbi:hypothetical protein [Brevundimonas sp.]